MTIRTAFALALAAGFTQAAAGGLFVGFSQPRQPNGFAGISLTQGGNPFGFADRRLADNFSLSSGFAINSFRWWGGSETPSGDSLANIAGFEIEIYEDDGGLPGVAVFTDNVTLSEANATLIPGETQGILGAAMYEFEVDMTGVGLGAGDYWISIAADVVNPVDFTNEAFQWAGSSVPSDGIVAQDRFDGQGYLLRDLATTDLAFELIGVPAPGAGALFGVATLALARRRR